MPTGLKRRYGQQHLHFITFSCDRRLPLLCSGSYQKYTIFCHFPGPEIGKRRSGGCPSICFLRDSQRRAVEKVESLIFPNFPKFVDASYGAKKNEAETY